MTPFLLLLIAATPQAEPNWLPPLDASPVAEQAPAGVQPTRYDTPAPAAAPADKPTAPPVVKESPFEQRLIALELALSAIVVEKPYSWRFDRLQSEAAAMLPLAKTERDRAAVRSIADRIERFERLSKRARQATDDRWRRSRERGSDEQLAQTRIAPPVRRTKSIARGGRHDAEGVLRPVVSKRPNAPKYAVIDDRGQIAALVTPTPKIDRRLKGMLGQRVGLDGQRGFLTDLRREHVVAERVTPLGTIRR